VHAFLSSQAAVLFALTQPVAGSHESSVQTFPSPQLTVVCTHAPFERSQASSVQASSSSQLFGANSQEPFVGLHVATVQRSGAEHETGVLLQAPLVQASSVHGFRSSQSATVLQQPSISVPTQAPPLHVSSSVQSLPSSQAPPVRGAFTQSPVTGSHESAVQTSPSSQSVGAEFRQVPSELQESTVQALPSSHTEPNNRQSLSHGPAKSPWAKWAASADALMVIVW
jgi:hypothetical protein